MYKDHLQRECIIIVINFLQFKVHLRTFNIYIITQKTADNFSNGFYSEEKKLVFVKRAANKSDHDR